MQRYSGRINFITKINDIEIFMFKPTLFSQYWFHYEIQDQPDYWKRMFHKLRMTKLFLFNKYLVFYGVKDGITIGHIVVSRNAHEFEGASKKDIIIGPKWTAPRFRGLGYGSELLRGVLSSGSIEYQNAYELISKVNYASIKSAQKCGYELDYTASKGKMGQAIKNKEGSWLVYRYQNKTK